ncbi:hypothetical protein [Salinarimonas sp.]|uniref:hypothetical protein n=1 Tax=Salinarimonas sp. TaxID=2766526 RepID=UPI0032D92755
MLGEDLLTALGASPIVLGVLLLFWTGDAHVSEDAKKALADWLKRDPRPPKTRAVRLLVEGQYERVFGGSTLSLRFIIGSIGFSLATLSSFVLIFDTFNYLRGADTIIQHAFRREGYITLMFAISVNLLADLASNIQTRIFLNALFSQKLKTITLIVLDFMLTTLILVVIAEISYYTTKLILDYDNLSTFTAAFFQFVVFESGSYSVFGIFASEDSAILYMMVATTYLTSVWIWAAAIGMTAIRLASRLLGVKRLITFVFPVDDKPIRSIGIVFAGVYLVVASIAALLPL